ncbi:Pectate lyase, partial [Thalictrum thalictroides]
MAYPSLVSLFCLFSLLFPILISSSPVKDPELVAQVVVRQINSTRRNSGYLSCPTGNPIDDCWRCDPNWEKNRQRLADCAIGFGKQAIGGRDGKIYVVTDPGNDDPVTPKPGTLRYAVIQDERLWIIFASDMVIQLKEELMMNSFKTIDGRGASVHIAGGPCITIHNVEHIIIHGLHIHDCIQGGNASVRNSPSNVGFRELCRHGYFHVVNNDYKHWEKYAIGGSAAPTINSQGNRFLALSDMDKKEVTRHEDAPEDEWKKWNWRSEGDLMLNGAFFTRSGADAGGSGSYDKAISLDARPSSQVGSITRTA